jgi:hypothetical protein
VGLLDDLENEAQRRRAEEESAVALKTSREAAYRTTLEPAMGDLLAYLKELVAKLKELQPKIRISHSLPGYGDVVGYVEHEYEVHENRQPSSKEITLSYFCGVSTSECPSVQIEGANRVRAVSALFQRHRLGSPLAPAKDASGEVVAATFKAKGRIPLTAVFSADTGTGQLRMSFSNFDDLATASKSVPPEQVGVALYDEIGRYLMRDPNQQLMREALPEDYRSQLRARVHQQEIKRRWESLIAARQQEEIAMLKREYGIGARFNRIGDAMGKLRGLVARKP